MSKSYSVTAFYIVVTYPRDAGGSDPDCRIQRDHDIFRRVSSQISSQFDRWDCFSWVGPPVHFYVNQEKPECLLIATADGNSALNASFQTLACCPRAELDLITMDDIILIRVIEIIFGLKDLLTNIHNYGWIYSTKRLLIIDFSIDNDEKIKNNSTSIGTSIYAGFKEQNRLSIGKLVKKINPYKPHVFRSTMRQVLEKLPDSFLETVDIATQVNESDNENDRVW